MFGMHILVSGLELNSARPEAKTSWDQRGNNADLDDYWVRY